MIREPYSPRWIPYQNTSGEEIPAFGVVRVAGEVTGVKSTTYGAQYLHAINWHKPVAGGDRGRYAFPVGTPVWAKFATGDGTPAIGEIWGPVNNDWELRKNVGGFQVVGFQTGGRTLVVQAPMLTFVGKTDAAVVEGGTVTVSIWHGALGSEVDSGHNMAGVHCRFGDLDANTFVKCSWVKDDAWEIIAGICSTS